MLLKEQIKVENDVVVLKSSKDKLMSSLMVEEKKNRETQQNKAHIKQRLTDLDKSFEELNETVQKRYRK